MRPTSAGGSRTGRVTSTVSVLRRWSRAADLSASRRVPMASVTRSLSPLNKGPCDLRSSGVIRPSVASSAETDPFLPSVATRTASSAGSSPAAAMSARIWSSRACRSDMDDPRQNGACVDRLARIMKPSLAGRGLSPRRAAASEGADSKPSGRQGGLGFFHDRLKCRWFTDREIRQHFAIDSNASPAEAVDKSTICQAEFAHGGIEALDPKGAKGSLAPLAVAEGILIGLLHRLLGDPNRILAPAVIAFGGLKDLLVFGVSGDAAFDASHD